MFKFIIKTFDQLKKHNFDQLNFGQTIPCRSKNYFIKKSIFYETAMPKNIIRNKILFVMS